MHEAELELNKRVDEQLPVEDKPTASGELEASVRFKTIVPHQEVTAEGRLRWVFDVPQAGRVRGLVTDDVRRAVPRKFDQSDRSLTRAPWGVNGCASVLSAMLATLIAMNFGFSSVIFAAALLYAFAAAVFLQPLKAA